MPCYGTGGTLWSAACSGKVAKRSGLVYATPPRATAGVAKGGSGCGRDDDEGSSMNFQRIIAWAGRSVDPGQLRYGVRTGLAAALTIILASLLGLEQGYWASITVVIVMQSDIGSSLMAGWSRLLGTFAGAVMGACAAWFFGASPIGGTAAVFLTLSVCAYLTILHPSFRLAGVTAAIVLGMHKADINPFVLASSRFAEVSMGILVALGVSFLWPSRATEVLRYGLSKGLKGKAALFMALVESRLTGTYQQQRIFYLKEQSLRLAQRNQQLLTAARREPGSGLDVELLSSMSRLEVRIFEHLMTMDHAIEKAPSEGFHLHLRDELEELAQSIEESLQRLAACVAGSSRAERPVRLDRALAATVDRLLALRRARAIAGYDLDEVMHFYSFYHAMKELAEDIRAMTLRLVAREGE